jgi:hypothetical protein
MQMALGIGMHTHAAHVSGQSHELPVTFSNPRHLVLSPFETGYTVLKSRPDSTVDGMDFYEAYSTVHKESHTVVLPEGTQSRRHVVSCHFTRDTAFLASNNDVYILARDQQTWTVRRSFRLRSGITGARFINDIVYLWNDVPGNCSSAEQRMFAYAMSLRDGSTVDIEVPPCVRGWALSYVQPRHVVSFSQHRLSYCDLSSYRIIIRDHLGRSDTVARTSLSQLESRIDIDTLDMSASPQLHFPALLQYSRNHFTITRATLLNDTLLGVVWSSVDTIDSVITPIQRFDLWSKDGGSWTLSAHDVDLKPRSSADSFSILDLYTWRDAHVSANGIAYVVPYPAEWDDSRRWRSYGDFVSERDAYFESRPTTLSLIVHRIH